MKRGTIIMIAGLSVQVVNWIFSSIYSNSTGVNSEIFHLIKVDLGYGCIVGWMVFFTGLGIRQLDKRRLALVDSKGKK